MILYQLGLGQLMLKEQNNPRYQWLKKCTSCSHYMPNQHRQERFFLLQSFRNQPRKKFSFDIHIHQEHAVNCINCTLKPQSCFQEVAYATFAYISLTKASYIVVLVAHSCSTLCDPMDCSLPGSSIHGILQTRILECIAIPFSRGSS